MPAIPQTPSRSPATLVRRVIIYSSGHSALPTWAIATLIVIGVLSFALNVYIYIKRKEKKERLRREINDLRAQVNEAPPQPEMGNVLPADGDKNNYIYNSHATPSVGMPAAPAQTYTPNNGAPEIIGSPDHPETIPAAQGLDAAKKERSRRWF